MTKRHLPVMSLARFDVLRARRDEAARRERAAGATARQWYKIVNAASDADEATIYIYDEIGYWGVTASDFAADLRDVTASRLSVRINSPGGECYDGIAIYNTLVGHDAYVSVKIDALAASAASFIAMSGDEIEISKNAEMMIHDASGFCWGNASEMRRMVEMLDRMSDNIASIYAERAGGTTEEWRAVMQDERWYSAREAVTAKLADRVIGDPKPDDLPAESDDEVDDKMSRTFDLSVFRFAGRNAAISAGHGAPDRHNGQSTLERKRAEWRGRMASLPAPRVRTRPHADYDPLQPRGDDGKWVGDGLPDGISGPNWLTWDAYNGTYDPFDESTTDAGLTAVSMTDGATQLAYDHPGDEDHRFVLFDGGSDDFRTMADVIENALDSGEPEVFQQGDRDVFAIGTLDDGDVGLTFFEAGDGDTDVDFEVGEADARALADALRAQADQADTQLDVDAVWSGRIDALTGAEPDIDDWAAFAATILATGSEDRDPFELLREAYA